MREILGPVLVNEPKLERIRLADIFELAFDTLSRRHPSEYFYKHAILQRNVLGRYGSKSSRVFFEFRAGQSKLDALVARESIHAYEIKTELDHFRRLPTQISDYRRRFAHVWLFASEKHASRLERELAIPTVGLAYLSSKRTFETIRPAVRDTSQLQSSMILECLRRFEYLEILREFGFEDSFIPNTMVFKEAMKFAAGLDPELVHEATLAQLKGRSPQLSASSLMRLPLYIRAAAVGAQCSDVDVEPLLKNLAKRMNSMEGV